MTKSHDERRAGRLRTGLLTAALAGGAVLGATQVGNVVNAQADDQPTEETDTTTDRSQVDDRADGNETGEGQAGDAATDAHGGRGGPGPEHRAEREGDAREIADLIGIDADELRDRLRDGTTLAEIAEENGVATDAVVDLIVEQVTERIDQAVEDGRIDADEADEKLAALDERVATQVEEGRPERGDREPGDGERCGPGGRGPRPGGADLPDASDPPSDIETEESPADGANAETGATSETDASPTTSLTELGTSVTEI